MKKYFIIKNIGCEEFIQEYETKEQMLTDIEEFCKYDGNTIRKIILGKELKLIKKEIVVKYDVEEDYSMSEIDNAVKMKGIING